MTDFKIVFIHGYTASHTADWYPAISPMLAEQGIDFVVPDLPGGKHPHVQEWMSALHAEISQTNQPLVLVGHSLGTRAALLYIEQFQPKVEKVFLIAAFANRLENAQRRGGEAYPDFFTHQIDIEKVKACVGEFIVMHSKDDHSIAYEQGVEIARDLSAELVALEDRDHFTKPDDAGVIFEVLMNKLF